MAKKEKPLPFTPEERILLLCAGSVCTGRDIHNLTELIKNQPNWDKLLLLAGQHSMLPLLSTCVLRYCGDLIPPHLSHRLRDGLFANSAHNLLQTGILLDLLDLFAHHDIPALPFKGALLASELYGDVGLRSFVDIDILIRKSDLSQAYQVLLAEEYVPQVILAPAGLHHFAAHEDNLSFSNPINKTMVELHWDLAGLYLARSVTFEGLEPEMVTAQLSGHTVRNLSAEALLVYLCVHGAKHVWERLEWVSGISRLLLVKRDLDWQRVFLIAKAWRCRRMVLLGVYLSHSLFRSEMPDCVAQKIKRDDRVSQLADAISRTIFTETADYHRRLEQMRFSSFHLAVRDNLPDRLRYILRLCFRPTSVEWKTLGLPPRLAFLYSLLRPARLAWGVVKRSH